jgi:hypothetical protein
MALRITGDLSGITGLPRDSITQEDLKAYPLPIENWRVWDAFQTALGTAGTDDLGIATGTFGTGLPYITTGDVKTLTATRYARALFTLPPEYVAGETIQIRFATGMITTIAGTSATIDAEAYYSDRDSTIGGSDLVSTAAASINYLTFAEKTFTVNPVGRNPGDALDIRVAIATVDAATGTAVIGAIVHAEVQLDIKG